MTSIILVIFFASTGDGGGVAQIEMPSMAACVREADKLTDSRYVRRAVCVDRREAVE
jgi:hypothetical protein